ncbi:DUF58 domain-containing protein [Neobacillus sp. SCS-31]|uniref:DUF58 domain-containing protein n=1 Tax=Neobacillus oceani TaxID=3115292 RepID=UPI0039066BBC
MTRSLKNLWDRFLFRDRGIVPTKRLLIAFLPLSALLLGAVIVKVSWLMIFGANVLFLALSLADLLFTPKRKELSFQRVFPGEMERGIPARIEVLVANKSRHAFLFRFIDGVPQTFRQPFPVTGSANGQSETIIPYETVASVRGDYQIGNLFFRYRSSLGLWEKQVTPHLSDQVKVIPDLTETRRYLENAQQFLLHEGTAIRRKRMGEGDFAKVRSYVPGDDPRKINWRQTAKLHEVMANEYEPEHGKYITLMIDCGRMMGAEMKKGNRLEQVLESVMTVAAAVLQKGDYVSVLAFSKNIKVYVPPAKGMNHLQTILQAIYGLEVDPVEPNYGAVLQYLENVQKKRSLLLLFSDVRTFLHEENALVYLKRLRQRHLFFMVGIVDGTLKERIAMRPDEVKTAMIKSIAQQQELLKHRGKNKWEKQGLQMVEAKEEHLAVTAISHYIDIMNQNAL